MKRILAIVLALSMVLGICLLAGCGDTPDTTTPSSSTPAATTGGNQPDTTTGGNTPDTTTGGNTPDTTTGGNTPDTTTGGNTPDTTTGGVVIPVDPFANFNAETMKLPGKEDVDFRGTKFVIVSSTVDSEFDRMPCEDIFSAEDDTISVAVRKRNAVVEKLYNCTVELMESANPGEVATSDITGNKHTIDLFSQQGSGACASTGTGTYNVLSLDIDFNQPWWDQKFVKTLSAKNSDGTMVLGHLMGDFCIYGMSCLYMLAFDKTVYESNGIEDKYGNIYELVRDNKWTMDVFTEMFRSVAKETSGDSTLQTSAGDILGWCTTNYAPHALHVASGLEMISTVDGAMTFVMPDHSAEWNDVVDKAIEIWAYPEAENTGYGRIPDVVAAHQTLFFSEVIDVLARWKDKEGLSLGLVPYPKYSESQEGYYNYVDNHMIAYAIPVSVTDIDTLADFVEVFTAHSRYIVRSAWIDAYSYEYCGDSDSAEMLGLILDSRTYDPGYQVFAYEADISDWITKGNNQFTKWLGRNTSKVTEGIATNVTKRLK